MHAHALQSSALPLVRTFFAPDSEMVAGWAAAAQRETDAAISPFRPRIAGTFARVASPIPILSARVRPPQPAPASREFCCVRSLTYSPMRSSPILPGIARFEAVAHLIERTAQPGFYGGQRNAEHLR